MRPVLGRARLVARRLGPLGDVRRGVRGRRSARERSFRGLRAERRRAHVHEADRGAGHRAVVAVHERRDAHGRPVLRTPVRLEIGPARRRAELRHTRLDEHLVRRERRLEHTGEELCRRDDALAALPMCDELGAERQHHRGHVGGRVAVGERPADRSPVSHLGIADLPGRVRDDGAVLGQQRVGGDRSMPCERADRDVRAAVLHVRQIGEAPDVDELLRTRDPELHGG